jgi:pimeloyl-ACP methyl ester carboxylesterase
MSLKTVRSKDGTTIAFEQSGTGSAIIVVEPALSDHSSSAKLAKVLAEQFTVITYDRRGRGQSTDTLPYAVEREVEDIEALIDTVGGTAFLFGSSSGAVLALEAADQLGNKVQGLFMYEPPFIVDDSRPPMPADFSQQIAAMVSSDRRNEAVRHFFHKGMGIPGIFVTLMRWLMPGWSRMASVAHTLLYDLAVVAGTQTGKPLPTTRWTAATLPILVMVGSKSEAFFHTGAQALANLLPNVQYRVLEGGSHGSVMMAPKDVAAAVCDFFLRESQITPSEYAVQAIA